MALEYAWKPPYIHVDNNTSVLVHNLTGGRADTPVPPRIEDGVIIVTVAAEGEYRLTAVTTQDHISKNVSINDPSNDYVPGGPSGPVDWSDIQAKPNLALISDVTSAVTSARLRSNHTGTQSADTVDESPSKKFVSAAQKTKLINVDENATANSTDAQLRDRSTHTGSQSADSITESAAKRFVTLDEKTKLGTVAENATSNASDASLRDRSTHTGTQAADSIVESSTKRFVSATEKTKLATIAEGATTNSTDSQLRDRTTHTGTQSADTVDESATKKFLTVAERTKLSGVATGATANATDAQLRDRTTHTGTQTIATVTGLQSAIDGKADALNGVTGLWKGTQAQYDAIGTKSDTVVYIVV